MGQQATRSKVAPALWCQFEQAIASAEWPVYVHGHAGRGKSCAAMCIFMHWPTGGGPVFFWPAGRVMRDLAMSRAGVSAGGDILRSVEDASLLVLDDIATREPTGPQLDALLDIINARRKLPMIVTGNQSPRELSEALNDDRIVSRVCSGKIIEVTGKDRRLENVKSVKV